MKTKMKFRCKKHNKIFYSSFTNILSGKNPCKQCFKEKHRPRKTIEEVRLDIKNRNLPYELISTKWEHTDKELLFYCNIHKEEFKITWTSFYKSKYPCEKCRIDFIKSRLVLPIEEVINRIKSNKKYDNFEIVSTHGYIDGKSKIKMKCNIHNIEWDATANSLSNGSTNCPKCRVDKIVKSQRLELNVILDRINTKNPNVNVVKVHNFRNHYSRADFYCNIHNLEIKNKKLSNAMLSTICPECIFDKNRGENNWRWNPDLTFEDRQRNRALPFYENGMTYESWRFEVYKKDDFTCQICGHKNIKGLGYSKNLNAHHKDSWDLNEDKRFDINNGVTLCCDCHKEFHSIYGYGNNTEEQYNEFKLSKER